MTEIAEAYIHLKPFETTSREIQNLGRLADSLAYQAARRVYRFEVTVDVYVEEGTLKGWARASLLGSLLPLYGALADYKGFKESIHEIASDARYFAGEFRDMFISQSGAQPGQIYRTERRTKTPGKLYRALDELEALERDMQMLPNIAVEQRLSKIRKQLSDAIKNLTPEDVEILKKALREHERRLPAPVMPKVAIRPDILGGLQFYDGQTLREVTLGEELPPTAYHNRFTVGDIPPELLPPTRR
jgi:hypothetical protein